MIFSKPKSTRLAIAVRDDSLLAAEEKKRKNLAVHLQAWSARSLPKGVVQNGKLIKPSLFKESVEQLLQKADHGHFTQSRCHLVLPEQLIQYHIARVKTPNTDFSPELFNQAMLNVIHKTDHKRTMEGQMSRDLSTWLHSSYSVAIHDYQRYEQALTDIGMTVQTYSSSAQAASAFYFMGGKCAEPLLWVHVGADQTEMALMDAYGIYQSEVVSHGVNQLVSKLRSQLGLNQEQVGMVVEHFGMRKHGSKHEGAIQLIFKEWLSEFFSHAKQLRTLSQLHHDENLQLLLCGQGAVIPGIAESFQQELDLDLRLTRSWARFIPQFSLQEYHQLVSVLGAVV